MRHKRVALIIDSMTAPRRTMINGVARYMQEHVPWSVYLKPPFVESELLRWLETWQGDGVIGKVTPDERKALRSRGIPFVDTVLSEHGDGYHVVRADDYAIGRVGAEHLLERGFKHFAFVDMIGAFWALHRFEGFQQRLKQAGYEAHLHNVRKPSVSPGGPASWESRQGELGEWIQQLPKPIGIMATTDLVGSHVLEACQRTDMNVPDTVAVLGADNDEPICRISTPPLSSVIINDELRGYECARVLAALMAGKPPATETVYVPPAGVTTRASTDVYAFEDELLVEAMRCLREQVQRVRSVDDLVDMLGVSRSTLDRRFRRVLGRSVNDEIIRLRLSHAVRLLSETRLPMKAIAHRCGFSSQSYMSTLFKENLGRAPTSYRRQ